MFIDLPASFDAASLKHAPQPPAVPEPLSDPDFWPETLVDWAGAVGPALTVAVIGLTVMTVYRAAKWRHEDRVDQRFIAASSVIIKVGRDAGRVSEIQVDNTGSEVMKNVEVKLLDSKTREAIELRHRTEGVIPLLVPHIAGDSHKVWKSWESDPLPTVEDEDGRPALRVSPQVTWVDAAGWGWRMDSNKPPVNTSRGRTTPDAP